MNPRRLCGGKCGCCGVAVTCDALSAAYVRDVDGTVLDVVTFALCECCAKRAGTHPAHVMAAFRRRYETEVVS